MAQSQLVPTPTDEIARLAHQEANHRLANSLHFVTMMLAIEERRVGDPTAKAALANARMRMAAIARLSRTLSQLDSNAVELDIYLGGICDEVAESFIDSSGAELIVNIDNIAVAPTIARTIGLVLHEFLVNGLKHGSPPRIEVMAGFTEAGLIELRVLNETTDPVQADGVPGLGTTIVRSLLQMSGGVYALERGDRSVAQVATLPRS